MKEYLSSGFGKPPALTFPDRICYNICGALKRIHEAATSFLLSLRERGGGVYGLLIFDTDNHYSCSYQRDNQEYEKITARLSKGSGYFIANV